jgi:molybdate transport system ATP-binding protein
MDGPLQIDVSHRLTRLALAVRLEVGPQTVGLVGPSGAGKSTVLRAVAGLLDPEAGRITLGDRVLLDTRRGISLPPDRRRIGMVFQHGALFPHMTVAGNVAYGLARLGRRRGHVEGRVTELLERFDLRDLASARPPELSGGERQRVSLARAVAAGPAALLLDEPLSALDTVTKGTVSAELARHLAELRLPTILVAHDIADILGLAARVAVMEQGSIVQDGTALELLQAPASAFVAALAGVNYFVGVGRRAGDLTEVTLEPGGAVVVSVEQAEGPVAVVVAPWEVSLSRTRPDGSALNALAGPIRRVTSVGNRVRITLGSTPPIVAEITQDSVEHLDLATGLAMVATWKATGTRLIPRAGRREAATPSVA